MEEWPLGSEVDPESFNPAVQTVLKNFAEAERPLNKAGSVSSRQLVVIHKGKIVGEYVKDGFYSNQPLLAWSMTKSVLNLLVGRLVKQGKLDLNKTRTYLLTPSSSVVLLLSLLFSSSFFL